MGWRSWSVAIVALQFAAVAPIAGAAGFRYQLPLVGYWKAALGISIIGGGIFALFQLLACVRRDEAQPAKVILLALRRLDLPLVAFLVGTQLALLGWLKVMMPYAVGFWADPLLAELDSRIFGLDPWKPLHALPLEFIDRVYLTWGPFCAATAIALAFAPCDRKKGRCLVAYFLTFGSCALGQYLLPSAGPVFFEAVGYGSRFADLPILPWVRRTADYLWVTYTSPGFRVGSGISAFPSLHVAGAFWIALVLKEYVPRIQVLGWAYWLCILVGSVYLGWHYALDGLAGSLLALGAFRAAIFLLGRQDKRNFGTARTVTPLPAGEA